MLDILIDSIHGDNSTLKSGLRVCITGHTSGIGKAIFDGFKNVFGLSVTGLSRTNGHDLEKDYDKVKQAVEDSKFDIFINNAYVPKNQTRLLKEIYNSNRDEHVLIVNIGSVAGLIPQDHPDYFSEYATNKREQMKFCAERNFEYSKKEFTTVCCGLVNINSDYVNTNFKSKYDKRLFPNLEPSDIFRIVSLVTKLYDQGICLREVSLHSVNPPRINENMSKNPGINDGSRWRFNTKETRQK